MNSNENMLSDVGFENQLQLGIEPGLGEHASLPIAEETVPSKMDLTSPSLANQTPVDKLSTAVEGKVESDTLFADTDTKVGLRASETFVSSFTLKDEMEPDVAISQGSILTTHTEEPEKTTTKKSSKIQDLECIRSWLLTPLLPRGSADRMREEDFEETLLHVVEDKMYLCGFYERMEREELVEVKRPSRRKRERARGTLHNHRRRGALGNSHESSTLGVGSFSFVGWATNAEKPSTSVEDVLFCFPDSTSLLAPDERNTFFRYALSSGKLRKECADPYQFLTARLEEVRHGLQEKLSAGVKMEDAGKSDL